MELNSSCNQSDGTFSTNLCKYSLQCKDFNVEYHDNLYTENFDQKSVDEDFDNFSFEIDKHINEDYFDSVEYITLVVDNRKRNFDGINIDESDSNNANINILRKYFNIWQEFSKNDANKTERLFRQEQIDTFIKNIIKKKNELNAKGPNRLSNRLKNNLESTIESSENSKKTAETMFSNGSYQHRYHVQKNIIALQKAKLEQQERIIEELKFKKIIEDTNGSNDIVAELRKTLEKCELKNRPKVKHVLGEDETKSIETGELLSLHCTRVPKFLQKMEQRARERQEKRAVVQERRRQIELEREKNKEQMEIARQHMDQEEKNRRLNEFKARRQQEQLIAIRKKEIREKMRAYYVMADLHHEKKVMDKYGISAWKLLIVKVKEDNDKAASFYTIKVIRNNFNAWRSYSQNIINKRNEIADSLYSKKMWRWVFDQWKLDYKIMIHKRQIAEDWYDLHVTERLFLQWRSNILKIRCHRKRQWELATKHYNSCLLWKAIGCWQNLPTIHALEREHEARKERWRKRVQEVLPDFIPRNVSD